MIPELKKLRDEVAPDTLLTINGNIPDRQTGLQIADQYGVVLLPASSKSMVRGFRGASELRNSLMNEKSTSEVRALLDEFGSKDQDEADEHGN